MFGSISSAGSASSTDSNKISIFCSIARYGIVRNFSAGSVRQRLPDPFRGKLHDSRRMRADASELRRVKILNDWLCFAGRRRGDGGRKAGAAKHELCVIEGVEQLGANLRL